MAVRKRGSRPIVIDGVRYRWRVPSRPTYRQGAYANPLELTVWQDDANGSVLHLYGRAARPDNWLGRPGEIVTPGRVAAGIRAALAAGWKPADPGQPCWDWIPPAPEPEAT